MMKQYFRAEKRSTLSKEMIDFIYQRCPFYPYKRRLDVLLVSVV